MCGFQRRQSELLTGRSCITDGFDPNYKPQSHMTSHMTPANDNVAASAEVPACPRHTRMVLLHPSDGPFHTSTAAAAGGDIITGSRDLAAGALPGGWSVSVSGISGSFGVMELREL